MAKLLMTVAALVFATIASAAPSVFVRTESGASWWIREMEARILGKSSGTVTADQLTAYLKETILYSPYEVCSLEAVQGDTFVGLDRATQNEIDETKPHVAWRIDATTPDGRRVVGQSVVFEACAENDPRGAAILVTDAETREILRWAPIGDQVGLNGKSYPAWALFLSAKESDELFSYSGCTECGARTYVYYDVSRKQIYTEYNGH